MFTSLYDELVFIRYQELELQFDEESCRSTSRYVYIVSGFCSFVKQQRKPFGLRVVSLVVLSKILFFIIVGWWHNIKKQGTTSRENT